MKKMQFLVPLIALLVSACGGGDGGSNSINFDRGALMFTGAFGASIPSQQMGVNVGLGSGSSARYVGVENKKPSLVAITYNVTHIDAFTVTVAPVTGLSRGNYSGSADVLVCSDQACSDVKDRATFSYTIAIN